MRIYIEEAKKTFNREPGCVCPVEAVPGAPIVRLEVIDECPAHRLECASCSYNTPLGPECGFPQCPRYEERINAQS